MAYQSLLLQEQIFAIDIGATNIKFSHVNDPRRSWFAASAAAHALPVLPRTTGRVPRRADREEWVPARRRRLSRRVSSTDTSCARAISRGPGRDHRKRPRARRAVARFRAQDALREKTGRDVRVVNDATMAALGCIEGQRHRTGLHARHRARSRARHRRQAQARARRRRGDLSSTARPTTRRSANGLARWTKSTGVQRSSMSSRASPRSSSATTVHLAGGNARRVVAQRVREAAVSRRDQRQRGADARSGPSLRRTVAVL